MVVVREVGGDGRLGEKAVEVGEGVRKVVTRDNRTEALAVQPVMKPVLPAELR